MSFINLRLKESFQMVWSISFFYLLKEIGIVSVLGKLEGRFQHEGVTKITREGAVKFQA